jgi:hypothetical protein
MRVARLPDQYADTRAARMLANGLRAAKHDKRSLRTIAKDLNYKQATVLSHMSKGRVPVPLDRAAQIAGVIGIDPAEFLLAAVEQRTSDAPKLLCPDGLESSAHKGFAGELALIAGGSLDLLDEQHRSVIREVVTDAAPRRRWLSPAELPLVLRLRELRPAMKGEGLPPGEVQLMLGVLGARSE